MGTGTKYPKSINQSIKSFNQVIQPSDIFLNNPEKREKHHKKKKEKEKRKRKKKRKKEEKSENQRKVREK